MVPINTLVIYGTKETEEDGSIVYNLKAPTRDAVNRHEVGLKENDKLLELVLEDGTSWMCDASTLHEVYPELDPALKPSGDRSLPRDEFELPTQIQSSASERGFLGKIVVTLLKVVLKEKIDKKVNEIAGRLEDQHLLNGIPKESPEWDEKRKKDYLLQGGGLFSIDFGGQG